VQAIWWLTFVIVGLLALTIVLVAMLTPVNREVALALLATAVPVELVVLGTLVAKLASLVAGSPCQVYTKDCLTRRPGSHV
jgi:hypothetical protein